MQKMPSQNLNHHFFFTSLMNFDLDILTDQSDFMHTYIKREFDIGYIRKNVLEGNLYGDYSFTLLDRNHVVRVFREFCNRYITALCNSF